MKFAIVTLAVVFNITLVVMYSRSLVGGSNPAQKPAPATPVAERSASSPYKPGAPSNTAQAAPGRKDATGTAIPEHSKVAAAGSGGDGKETVAGGDGKETIDPKDGKETLAPVAEDVRALRLRSDQGRPSAELLPGSQPRGILSPANPANIDPPVVSPEAR